MSIRYFILFLLMNSCLATQSNCHKVITLESNNTAVIEGEITDSMASVFVTRIHSIFDMNIYVYIRSGGGSVPAGMRMANAIDYVQANYKTVHCVVDHAYSMAFHILQHCKKRYIVPNGRIMQHQISITISEQIYNLKKYMHIIESVYSDMMKYESNRLGMSITDYSKQTEHDWWEYGTGAINSKMVDCTAIIGCSKSFILDINSVKCPV